MQCVYSHHLVPLPYLDLYLTPLTAHCIRNSSSKQFRAVQSLFGRSRWCLTGTPIQNKLDDLISLGEFLRLPPFTTRRQFEIQVLTPLSVGAPDATKALRAYLQAFCLRRSRRCLSLPPSRTELVELFLSQTETADYQDILHRARWKMDAMISRRNATKYNVLFTAILKLRRFCVLGHSSLEEKLARASEAEESGCDFCMATDEDTRLLLSNYAVCPHCSRYLQISSPLLEYGEPGSSRATSQSPASHLERDQNSHQTQMDDWDPPSNPEIPTKISAVLRKIAQDTPGTKQYVARSFPHATSVN